MHCPHLSEVEGISAMSGGVVGDSLDRGLMPE